MWGGEIFLWYFHMYFCSIFFIIHFLPYASIYFFFVVSTLSFDAPVDNLLFDGVGGWVYGETIV